MRYILEINTDNAAFEDNNTGAEVARILRKAADELVDLAYVPPAGMNIEGKWRKLCGLIRDVNGNRIGRHGFQITLRANCVAASSRKTM